MELPVSNLNGEVVASATLDDQVWDIEPNRAVLHQAVVAQQANARRGTADTKTRGEVRGGGKKHHRQKGTGMARAGSTRAPNWRGGGVVFGPHPRDWHQALPKKMRRLAMRSALSAKVDDDAVRLVDGWELAEVKTRAMLAVLTALSAPRRTVVVLAERDPSIERASSNLPEVSVVTPATLTLIELLKAEHVLISPAAAEAMTEKLLRPIRPRKAVAKSEPGAPAEQAAAGGESA
jgi:large subunit ribosomal protein L4